MDEDLILKVVRQVLDDPRIRLLLKGRVTPEARPEMLVLLNYAPDLPELLREMRDIWGDTYRLRVLASEAVERCKPELPAGMEWISCREAYGICWQRMVLPTCSANTLAKIALGLRDTPISLMAAEGITRGIPVEVCTARLRFTDRTPAAYRGLYEGYLRQLRSYGVILRENLSEGNIPAGRATGASPPIAESRSSSAGEGELVLKWDRRLMTEKDVLGFPVGCTVAVASSTIISPLARDMIKRRRIDIRREGVGTGDSGTGGR